MNALLTEVMTSLATPDYEPPAWVQEACQHASKIVLSCEDEAKLNYVHDHFGSLPVTGLFGTPVEFALKLPAGWALIVMGEEHEED